MPEKRWPMVPGSGLIGGRMPLPAEAIALLRSDEPSSEDP
jgi:hypothetical protein